MSLAIHPFRSSSYQVATPIFSGPLDLLLHLIERAELDITRLSLAKVTDQYLGYIRAIQESSAEEVSAFLVIAAKLLQIKSEMLLPRPSIRETGEEEPGDALVRQLLIYKKFKEVAQKLSERETARLHCYPRLAPPPRIQGNLEISGVELIDILTSALIVFSRIDQKFSIDDVVTIPKFTIREKIVLIVNNLRDHSRTSFFQLIRGGTKKLEVVVTFLALLELIKRHLVQANQEQLFGEIEIEPSDTWDADTNFDLEFGD
jgi:segregation and condensation protein A